MQVLFNASDMVLFNLIYNCKYNYLKAYIPYQINELKEYDDTCNTELTHTLKTYLKQNRSTTQTAEYLHIHRSTLFYRLKKIEKLLSLSINDSKSLFFYELSFAIQEYFYSDSITPSKNKKAFH